MKEEFNSNKVVSEPVEFKNISYQLHMGAIGIAKKKKYFYMLEQRPSKSKKGWTLQGLGMKIASEWLIS